MLVNQMDKSTLRNVLSALNGHSINDLISGVLHSCDEDHPIRLLFLAECSALLILLFSHPTTQAPIRETALGVCTHLFMSEIARLSTKESGWHFSAENASCEQIEAFSIEKMAERIQAEAPLTWNLLKSLLISDPARDARRTKYNRDLDQVTAFVASWFALKSRHVSDSHGCG
jgi:hypothetical protein